MRVHLLTAEVTKFLQRAQSFNNANKFFAILAKSLSVPIAIGICG
jgi:hypothetical protein